MASADTTDFDARLVIGPSEPDDWRFDLEGTAKRLGADGDLLARRLLSDDLAPAKAAYRAADDAAVRAQALYRRLATVAAVTSFLAVLLGTATLIFVPFGLPIPVIWTATGGQAVLVVLSLAAAILNGWLRPFEDWQMTRSEAEGHRLAMFDILSKSLPAAGEDPRRLLALQLEFFCRFQLNVQRAYFRRRAAVHAAAARRARLWRYLAMALVVAGAGSLLWSIKSFAGLPDPVRSLLDTAIPDRTDLGQRLFLALGIWASALQNLLSSLALITLDERNALRYRGTSEILDSLEKHDLPRVREAMTRYADDPEEARNAVGTFIDAVHDQLSLEHREWNALRKVATEIGLKRARPKRRRV